MGNASSLALVSIGYLCFVGMFLESKSLAADRITTGVLVLSIVLGVLVGGLAWAFCLVAVIGWMMGSSFKF
jgi:hypothetical protein